MSKVKTIIIIVLSVLLFLTISQTCYIRFSNKLEVRSYEYTTLQITSVEITLTKSTAKQLIKDLYNTPHIYIEGTFKDGRTGNSMPLLRYVKMDKNATIHDYIIGYAHELTHIKYQVGNETYVSYMTFVNLYESGNAELKYHAMIYANEVVSGDYAGTDYDCGYYILEYLGGINEIKSI